MKKNHPFHMVTKSPWPILLSINISTTMMGTVMWMTKKEMKLMIMGYLMVSMCSLLWWRDITRESTFQGNHTMKILKSMKLGMITFIISEIMFFSSIFWSFFHSSLSPAIEIGMNWPPKSINPFNPMEVPLLNTIILLSSGASITWAHQSIILKKMLPFKKSMIITILLGIYFSILQQWEYKESMFSFSDSIYGSTFFMATGFHGLHVMVGTTFILVCLIRGMALHFSNHHHLGMEAASWYWHFVDVIWMFLYITIYWWGK